MSGQRIELSQGIRDWLRNAPTFPETFVLELKSEGIQKYRILDRESDGTVHGVSDRVGFKGFVLRVQPEGTQLIRAAKFAVPQDYDYVRGETDEQNMAEALRSSKGLFLTLGNCGRVDVFDEMPRQSFPKFVCFISDWVDGESLESVIINRPEKITPHFITNVSIEFNRALNFLRHHNLKHDDLHPGNLMIKKKDEGLLLDENES